MKMFFFYKGCVCVNVFMHCGHETLKGSRKIDKEDLSIGYGAFCRLFCLQLHLFETGA